MRVGEDFYSSPATSSSPWIVKATSVGDALAKLGKRVRIEELDKLTIEFLGKLTIS